MTCATLPMPAEPETLTRREGVMLEAVGRGLRPRKRERPSEWARRLRLTRTMGSEVEGPYKPEYYPWGPAFLDSLFDNPTKAGVICPKRAQGGITLIALILTLRWAAVEGGNTMHIFGREEEAGRMAASRFLPMRQQLVGLDETFGARDEDDKRTANVMRYPYDRGEVCFVPGQSAGALSSFPYALIIGDEWDQAERAFAKAGKFGALLEFISGRQLAVRGAKEKWIFSHPTLPDAGVWRLWETLSDQGRWVFDCPHCKGVVSPLHTMIQFRETNDVGAPVAGSAWLCCPCCGEEITDQQRRAAVWPAAGPGVMGGREGGSGRFWSPLDDAEAAEREYAGRAVWGLADPYLPLSMFAGVLAKTWNDENARQSALNVIFGETSQRGRVEVSADHIRAVLARAARKGEPSRPAPGGRLGVLVTAAGADVQAPRENPLMYCAAAGLAADGRAYITSLELRQGWGSFAEWLRSTGVPVTDGVGTDRCGQLGLEWLGIDDAFESGQVKDFCRQRLHSAHGDRRIGLVPVRFVSSPVVNRDSTHLLRKIERRTDPERPGLGAIDMYDLHRHSYVERALRMIQDGMVLVLCEVPKDLEMHLTSQVLTPKNQPHNWGEQKLEWDLAKGRRDDWLMAIAYAVVAGLIKGDWTRRMISANTEAGGGAPRRLVVPRFGRT